MVVYTFSTDTLKESIYLDNLSSSILGVGNLINDYFLDTYTDREFSSIQLVGNKILVWYIDIDTNTTEKVYYYLVSIRVL